MKFYKLLFIMMLTTCSLINTKQVLAAVAPVKTLIIVSHPYPEHSTYTKALAQAASTVENVTIRNLEQIYGFVVVD